MKAKIKLKMIKCGKCGEDMPQLRLTQCGYKNCIKCSEVQPYGCVHISNGKTGNEIQILPSDVAERVNRMAERNGFGVMRGMKESV